MIGGQFTFPKGSELVSVVYAVSIASEIQQPLTLEIQHCVSLNTSEQSSYMKFAKASFERCSLPYQFHLLEEGEFHPDDRYGKISLTEFSFICEVFINTADLEITNSPAPSESHSNEMPSSPIDNQSSTEVTNIDTETEMPNIDDTETELPKIDTETEMECIQPAVIPNQDSSIASVDTSGEWCFVYIIKFCLH